MSLPMPGDSNSGRPFASTWSARAAMSPLPCVYVSRSLIQLRCSGDSPLWSTSRAATTKSCGSPSTSYRSMSSEPVTPKYCRSRCSCSNVPASWLGSSSRAFGAACTDTACVTTGGSSPYAWTTASSMPYACRVASMLRAMYCDSRWTSLGLTRNCWVYAGNSPPSTTAESTSRASAPAGSRMLRTTMLAKNSSAHSTATPMRMFFAGSTELTSVYDAPCTNPRLENARPNRSR